MALNPSPLDLTTVANLQAWLSENVTQSDALQRLVTAISASMQRWMNRTIVSQSYSELRDGTGGVKLMLAHSPVTAVALVVVDGQAIPASTGAWIPGYVATPTAVVLNGYRFNRGSANVQITYTAGFAKVPYDLEQACLEQCAFRWKERGHVGQSSVAMSGQQTNFTVRDFLPGVLATMKQYRKVTPC